MGLIANIFRSDMGDCSNNGVSAKYNRVCVVNCDGPFEAEDGLPAVLMVKGNLPGTVKIVPLDLHESKRWTMFGGTYVGSSDARFGRKVEQITGNIRGRATSIVAFHDRVEN